MKTRSCLTPKRAASRRRRSENNSGVRKRQPAAPAPRNRERAVGISAQTLAVFRKYEKVSPFEIKDKLISLAKTSSRESAQAMLNAGRGNPNWVATTPRDAFFLLGQFGMLECKRIMDLPDLGGMPEKRGIALRLTAFLDAQNGVAGGSLLRAGVAYAVQRFGFDADDFVHELVDAIVGDNYPVPDRMLVHG